MKKEAGSCHCGPQGKGTVLAAKGSGNTRQRRCLTCAQLDGDLGVIVPAKPRILLARKSCGKHTGAVSPPSPPVESCAGKTPPLPCVSTALRAEEQEDEEKEEEHEEQEEQGDEERGAARSSSRCTPSSRRRGDERDRTDRGIQQTGEKSRLTQWLLCKRRGRGWVTLVCGGAARRCRTRTRMLEASESRPQPKQNHSAAPAKTPHVLL